MNEHITRRQLVEQRIYQIKSILNGQYGKLGGDGGKADAGKVKKRKLTPKRTAELYSKLAALTAELNAL